VPATDPFRPVELTIEYVSSAAGSAKTYSAVAIAIKRARTAGAKIMFVMPTLQLIREFVEFARRQTEVPVIELTSRAEDKKRRYLVTAQLQRHLRAPPTRRVDPMKLSRRMATCCSSATSAFT
jgi:hypothetical protein